MFAKYDENGDIIRNQVVLDCQQAIEDGEEVLVEQNHIQETNINEIIRRHGIDLIRKTAMLQSQTFQFDDVTGNDFQEAMEKVNKAQESFEQMPSELRAKFEYNPAKFLDFVQNPDNINEMVEMGLAIADNPPPPVQVQVVEPPQQNPETPPE